MPSLKTIFRNIIFGTHPHVVVVGIPEFPHFKNLELSDKEEVERITSKFPPYSDFNFVSMWSWDIKGDMRISMLNNNLVVRFTDYVTGEPFYSFLGDNKVNETAEALIQLSKEEGLKPSLKLVPESVAKQLDSRFQVIEDRDHFDYILDNEKIQLHKGKKLRYHANLCKRLECEFENKLIVKKLDLNDENQKKEVLMLTNTWIQNKNSESKDTVSNFELDAIKKFFLMTSSDLSIGIFYNNKLIGCSINDPLRGDFSLCHFMKADNISRGMYSCLFIETSKIMLSMGKKYMNIEQDLGMSNLRQSKESFEPIDFLKKYIVTGIV